MVILIAFVCPTPLVAGARFASHLMWLNGWCSAWPDPSPHSPIPRAAMSSAVRLDPKFAKKATSMELTRLPEDVLARLIRIILLGDRKGTRFARTCKTSNNLCMEVMTSLVLYGVAWWTGSGKPYQPLPVLDPNKDPMCSGWRLHKAAMNLTMRVPGMDESDLARLCNPGALKWAGASEWKRGGVEGE